MTVVLARKYRPQFFKDVIGQDIFVRMIRNALRQDLVGHGFLITGIRGIGKTTLARLMAKALTCAQLGKDQEPCGVCVSCEAIVQDKHLDVLEIDAASHTGVDDIRQLIEGCGYKPVMGAYKIFIIDEVHMLSKNAFNALLKTLEEPPSHVKFILATTELHKVPLTIVSRCQQLHLKRVTNDVLADYLKKVCLQEGFQCQESALDLIAKASDGGVRDALVLLERALLLSSHKFLEEPVVRDLMAIPNAEDVQNLLDSILSRNIDILRRKVQESYQSGIEPRAVLEGVMDELHRRIVTLMQQDASPSVTDRPSISILDRMWQLAYKGWVDLSQTPFPLPHLEMIMMRMAYLGQFPSPEELLCQAEPGPSKTNPASVSNGSFHREAEGAPSLASSVPEPGTQILSHKREGAFAQELVRHKGAKGDALLSPVSPNPEISHETFKEALNSSYVGGVSEKLCAREEAPLFFQESSSFQSDRSLSLHPQGVPHTPTDPKADKSPDNWFSQLLDALHTHREPLLHTYLTEHVIFVSWIPGKLVLKWASDSSIPPQMTGQLQGFLKTWTGSPCHVEWVDHAEGMTLKMQQKLAHEELKSRALHHPLLKAAKEIFPDFILEEVKGL